MFNGVTGSGRTRAFSRILAMAVVWMAAAGPTWAQQAVGTVAEIKIEGNRALTESYVRQQISHVRLGQTATVDGIRKDVDKLKLTGKFEDVFATTAQLKDGVSVTFHLTERKLIRSIKFQGAKKFKPKDLTDELDFKETDFLDRLRVQGGAEAIQQKYLDAGYNDVSVLVNEEDLANGDVIYQIIEGPRVKVRKILFEGNTSYTDNRLKGQVETKTYIWILRTGQYDEEQTRQDITALRNFYRREGFLDVQVGRRLEFSSDRKSLTVTFVIEEGQQYSIKSITIEGASAIPASAAIGEMTLQEQSQVQLDILDADVTRIKEMYEARGYIYVDVKSSYTFADTPTMVDLKISINEGKSYQLGRIIIRGNERTQDRVVRRTLTIHPTETFDMVKARKHQQRLKETRLFSDADIRPVGNDPDSRDCDIKVEEANTTWVMAGVGVSSNNGVMGKFTIENWNFDAKDWPRNYGELFRGRAFKGAGQLLRFSLEPGTEMSRFRIDFQEPYLFDRPLSFGSSVYLFDRARDGYDEQRAGGLVSLGKRFKEIWSLEGALRAEAIKIDDLEKHYVIWPYFKGSPKDIREVEGNSVLTTGKMTLARDTTDSYWLPSKGTRTEVAWEQAGVAGGDYDFSKLTAEFVHHKTLRTDVFDRKTVWDSSVRTGYIFGDCPVFERFYGGGIGSIRGFHFRGVSPRQNPGNTQVGGDFEFLVGNEISFPLVGKNLRGVTFVDMGTVEDGIGITTWRMAAGVGVRLTLDFFGPVPMSFDLGFPISKDSDDDTQVFSFSMGATFK